MKISTRGRYALRFMVNLANQYHNNPTKLVSLKEIASEENISIKYLEQIAGALNKAKLIQSVRGAQGGYCLSKAPKDYNLKEILEVLEGPIACVTCLEGDHNECERKDQCVTLPIYEGLNRIIDDYFANITLDQLNRSK